MRTWIFALPGNEALAQALSTVEGCAAGECLIRNFPDGETYLRFQSPVRGCAAVLVCTLDRPDDKLLRAYLAARTLRALGATRVVLVAPYLPYMRQDTQFQPGEGISARHVADLLSGCVDALITVDPHLHRVARLEDLYRVPARVVPAAPAIARWIGAQVAHPLLIGPDEESAQWVSAIAERLGCPWRVLRKQRDGDRAVRIDATALDDRDGAIPVLMDDIVSSGTTMIEVLGILGARGMHAPVCVVVHGLFAGDALAAMRAAGAARIAACNTVAHAVECIDLAPDLANALACLLEELG